MQVKNFINLVLILTMISFLLLNCSSSTDPEDDTTTTATVLGTMTLPAAADGKTYSIIVDADDNGLNGFVKMGGGTCGSLTTVDYSIADVPAGDYYISAVVYVVSTPGTVPTSGDYGGFFGSDSIPTAPNATVTAGGSATFDFDLTVVP